MRTNSASRRRNGRRRRSALRLFVTILQIGVLLSMGILAGTVLGWFASLSKTLPNISAFEAPEATLVYSSDGVLLGRVFRENRTNVALKDIPKNLRDATVAIEDKRFYEHSGVDIRGVARAVFENLRGHRLAQGGSTITQQLARNVYLTQRKTIQRKIQEIFLAILIERNFSKDRILELYLNQIFYGSGAFGVQAASHIYFGKDVKELSLAECALIAGLPQKPSGYSPHENLNAAVGRRNTVLATMAELGYISPEQRDAARAESTRVVPRRGGRNAYKAPHFVDYVTGQLRAQYGDDVLYGGGLRVYTTLNWQMQQIAEKALRNNISRNSKAHNVSEGCLIALDPTTGAILAMVGSVDPKSHFNRCTQAGRQPGSSFKAFVYTAALESGMKPTSAVYDTRDSFPAGGGKWWTPRNYDGKFHGRVTMEKAVAFSYNMAAIHTTQKVGVKNVIKYARLMGITAPLEPYLPIAIGGIRGVHPIEMASAYGTFANDGAHAETMAITRIANGRNETQEDFTAEPRQVISKEINSGMDRLFRAVVTYGYGRGASGVSEARGKTGTTNDDRDVWFIGYVPKKIVTAVWVGNDNNSSMKNASGAALCVPVWREFMLGAIPIADGVRAKAQQNAQKQKPKPGSGQPAADQASNSTQPNVTTTDGVETVKCRVCSDSGLLATSTCPHWRTKSFPKGTEPTANCNIHGGSNLPAPTATDNPRPAAAPDTEYVTVTVCSQSGMLAGRYCPRVKKRFPVDEVPTQVCNLRHDQMRE
jgi:penicillin-binding protein 1A